MWSRWIQDWAFRRSPVSYTHLDVYKRQHLQLRMVRILTCSTAPPVMLSTPSFMIRAARFGVIMWFAFTRTSPSLFLMVSQEKRPVIPVSYTHLDVYKRQTVAIRQFSPERIMILPSAIKSELNMLPDRGPRFTCVSKMCIRDRW